MVVDVFGPSVRSVGVEVEREPTRVPPPKPETGSGKSASSVSSGGVEAEVKAISPLAKAEPKTNHMRRQHGNEGTR